MTKYSREVSGLGQGDAANENPEPESDTVDAPESDEAPEVTETTTESDQGTVTTTTTEAPTE